LSKEKLVPIITVLLLYRYWFSSSRVVSQSRQLNRQKTPELLVWVPDPAYCTSDEGGCEHVGGSKGGSWQRGKQPLIWQQLPAGFV